MTGTKRRRRAILLLLRGLLLLVAVPLLWFIAALVLGTIPANVAWHEPDRGVTIFVRTNGVHTWIVMPKENAIMNWRPYARPEHLRDRRYGFSDHVAVGYGNRDFYLNTPTWADLTVRTAFYAAAGNGETLLHVEHIDRPAANEWQRPIRITPAQYRRLVDYVRARFRLDAQRRPVPLLGQGFAANDMFYEARGGYSFVLTCNEWTGRALRAAGIRTGLWTPLSQSIMWRLD
ncbi:MAG: TIGR02117 family protein [Allosphingosinicella sp.]